MAAHGGTILPGRQGEINEGGGRPPGAVVDPLWKSFEMGLGSILDSSQLNNSSTQ